MHHLEINGIVADQQCNRVALADTGRRKRRRRAAALRHQRIARYALRTDDDRPLRYVHSRHIVASARTDGRWTWSSAAKSASDKPTGVENVSGSMWPLSTSG